jgi:hypothetical protein
MLPTGRSPKSKAQFVRGLFAIYDHPDYISLKPNARALLWDLCRQYNGHNNGDLSLSESVMKKWGWYKNALLRNKKALIDNNWIFISGHKKARNGFTYLYALTWLQINQCDGKLYPESYAHKPRSLKSRGDKMALLNLSKVS